MKILRPRPSAGRPTVTVVIPCYKYGHFLAGVVESVLSQPGVDADVIIVDDASPDDSGAVADSLADTDPRISVIHHQENRRHIATYNDGLAAATGSYVVLLSADDLLAPGSLERATALMEHDKSIGFVYGYSPDFATTPPPPAHRYYTWSTWTSDQWVGRICHRASNVVSNPEVVMRRSVMDQLGGYDPRFPHTADLLVWLRAATLGNVGRVNGPDQGYYRVHGSNMHLTDFGSVLTDVDERIRTFDTFLAEDIADPVERTRLGNTVHRAIAVECLRWAIWTLDTDPISGADSAGSASAYADRAMTLWPAIEKESLGRQYLARTQGRATRTDRLFFKADWELRHRLRWRRWRRFGT